MRCIARLKSSHKFCKESMLRLLTDFIEDIEEHGYHIVEDAIKGLRMTDVMPVKSSVWATTDGTCPECGSGVAVFELNKNPRFMVEGMNTMIDCNNTNCGWGYFTKVSIRSIMTDIKRAEVSGKAFDFTQYQ